jgi:ABC-2 type transport system permease protein
MLLIARRDLLAYLNAFWGYAVSAAVLIIDGMLFNAFALGDKAKYSSQVIENFFEFSFGSTIIAAILLTMRLVAEERQTGTIALVDSSPLRPWQVIGGKYLSAMAVLVGLIALTLYMPALVLVNGKVSVGHLVAGYLGLVLVASATAAIGTFASAISRSQLVAGFVSVSLVMVLLLAWLVARVSDPPLKDVFSYMSLFDRHFPGFMRGQINTEDVMYYLSITFVFLMMATRYMAVRRWR